MGINSYSVRTVTLSNPTTADITATIGSVTSASGDQAAFTQTGALGVVTIAAGTNETATITFNPAAVKSYQASVQIRLAPSCALQTISLVGIAVDKVLTWAPDPVTFGYAPAGFEALRVVTFTNAGAVPVQLSNGGVQSSDYRLVTPLPSTVPATGTAQVTLGFSPTALGVRNSTFTFASSLAEQPSNTVALNGIGGGPELEVTPSPALAFGSVAFFPNSLAASRFRPLRLKNRGTAPPAPDPAANLRLGKIVGGVVGQQPWFEVSPLNSTTLASEFTVTVDPAYNSTVGLPASAETELVVKFTPASLGAKAAELTIHSNALLTPARKITLSATAITLPDCSFSVSPSAVDFGLVSGFSEFSVTIANTGAGGCQFSSVAIAPGSDPGFQLAGGPMIPQLDVAAGDSTQVVVRLVPSSPPITGPITGTLQFEVSSATAPPPQIPLSATIGPTCLTLVPNHFDFNAVQKTCSSATVSFAIYNSCTTSAQISSASMTLPAGEPPGGPNCASAAACPEFLPVNTAGLVPGTIIPPGAAPTTFTLKYRPINDGSDTGVFSLTVLQGTSDAGVSYVLPLAGRGNSNGANVDTHLVGDGKADVLLIVDDSCSMGVKQDKLAAGFSSFVSMATGVDYQIGVTTTDMATGKAAGSLVAPLGGPKILTPATPNLATAFANNVKVGINGNAIEQILAPAAAAVTQPLVSTANAGLVRAGATLGIVAISDADDQSPQPASYYVNLLSTVKGPGALTFSSIGPTQTPAPCTYDGAAGPRTRTAVTAFNGLAREVCDLDWNPALAAIGAIAFGGRHDSYLLDSVPDLTGGKVITVKVDGATVNPVATNGVTVWSYDSTANVITFSPFYLPQPGQTVSLHYFAACLP